MDEPTDFDRPRDGLEEFLMACVCVAGKSAHVQAARLHRFLNPADEARVAARRSPFDKLRWMAERRQLYRRLVAVGMGKYELIAASFRAMIARPRLCLRTAPWSELATLPGVGEKTAKFFVLHSRAGARVAVLDTHMHKNLKAEGHAPPAFPPASPLAYRVWEDTVLRLADRAAATPAEYDLAAWRRFRRPPPPPPPPGPARGSPAGPPARPAGPRSRS